MADLFVYLFVRTWKENASYLLRVGDICSDCLFTFMENSRKYYIVEVWGVFGVKIVSKILVCRKRLSVQINPMWKL